MRRDGSIDRRQVRISLGGFLHTSKTRSPSFTGATQDDVNSRLDLFRMPPGAAALATGSRGVHVNRAPDGHPWRNDFHQSMLAAAAVSY